MDSEQHKPQTGASPLHLLVADRMGEAEGSGPDGLILRMLRIESALYLAAEARGYAVKQGLIIVEGSEIAFEFRERIRASLTPSGKLALKAKSVEWHHTKTWNDKVGQPLEKRIAEIVDGLGVLAEKIIQSDAQRLQGEAEYEQALRDTARRFEKRRERGAKKKRLRGFPEGLHSARATIALPLTVSTSISTNRHFL